MLSLMWLLFIPFIVFAEKLYVVERERGALAVVEDGRLKKEITELGNLNHATLKLWRGRAYLISRDGYLSQIDIQEDRLVKRIRVGESTIGIDFTDEHIVVANYEPRDVVVLNENLQVVRKYETGSRNVGIKGFKGGFVFSLMDKDEIWLVKGEKVKVFERVGSMPFDAFLKGNLYVVGFFKEGGIGLLDIEKEEYRRVSFSSQGKDVVFKIPHFGTWGVVGDRAFIPAVGEKKLYVVSLKSFEVLGYVELPGLPVFAVASPDGRYVAVNFSGDMEDFVAVVDTKSLTVFNQKAVGERVMHMRFSLDGSKLYVSSYFDSKLRALKVPGLEILEEVSVPNPSGVFLI
ncbi:MAG: cytochrome D1 domain-containing protein, partial [Aquificaceae bacterium]